MQIPHPLVIFAGGKSSRMGRDKALLPFGGHPTLTEYQIARLKPYFEKIYVGCKSKEKFGFEADFIEDLPQYEDAAPFIGMLSAFYRLDTPKIAVLSVDVPFFDAEDFQTLFDRMRPEDDICIAQSPQGDEPLCGIYDRAIVPVLKRLIAERRYRFAGLFEKSRVRRVPFDTSAPFVNLNTPDEYARHA